MGLGDAARFGCFIYVYLGQKLIIFAMTDRLIPWNSDDQLASFYSQRLTITVLRWQVALVESYDFKYTINNGCMYCVGSSIFDDHIYHDLDRR